MMFSLFGFWALDLVLRDFGPKDFGFLEKGGT
jgi:hypothetical protein